MAFEALLTQADARPTRWRRIALVVSIALHVLALIAGAIHSFWNVEELPLPAVQVTLAAELPPPPPPPPPPKKKSSSSTVTKTKPTEAKQLTQPREDEKVEAKEAEEDSGDDQGEEGGVEGGVAGGVVGGVVGSPAPTQPKPTGPKRLTTVQGKKQVAVNTQVRPYRMDPPKALQSKKFVAAFYVCVNEQGATAGLKQTRSSGNPTIDTLMKRAVGSWRYRPLIVDGVAIKFCWDVVYVHDES